MAPNEYPITCAGDVSSCALFGLTLVTSVALPIVVQRKRKCGTREAEHLTELYTIR